MMNATRFVAQTSRLRAPFIARPWQPRRFAHSSYGNEQSGHEQGTEEVNPKRHMEHPGPEAPATKSSSKDSAASGSNSGDNNARPAIHEPKSAAEDSDPEVRKHNEEMRERPDRSVNQLSEDDNKVDKNYWQGDVGDTKDKKD